MDYEVARPMLFELYHTLMPMVDQHNARRQGHLRLEKAWSTKDAFIRFFACWLGVIVVCIVNAYLMSQFFSNQDNPIRGLDQRTFVKRLSIEMMEYAAKVQELRGSSSSGSSSRAAAAEAGKQFDFFLVSKHQRCQTQGCKGFTNIKCKACSGGLESGSAGAYCSVYYDRAKGGKRSAAEVAAQGEDGGIKRGCMAMHAAACALMNKKDTRRASLGPGSFP
jgi:hypothetical protein